MQIDNGCVTLSVERDGWSKAEAQLLGWSKGEAKLIGWTNANVGLICSIKHFNKAKIISMAGRLLRLKDKYVSLKKIQQL